jgi:hypothetical protein
MRTREAKPLADHSYRRYEQKGTMKISIRICISKRASVIRTLRAVVAAFGLLAVLVAVSGCSSSSTSSQVQVGQITFTNSTGAALKTQPASLPAGQTTYVSVNLTNDSGLLGLDWTVYCASALTPGTQLPPGQTEDLSCGSITPAHTLSGPIPTYATSPDGYIALYAAPAATPKQGTVTIYAAATKDHSKVSSVTLTVSAPPISVSLAPAPPVSMNLGASVQIAAVVANDNANAGVTWTATCGVQQTTNCGSFSPTTTASGVASTYTTPASVGYSGYPVTVTATSVTDSTKSASASFTVVELTSNSAIAGTVQSASQPVSGAQVSLYAAQTVGTGDSTSALSAGVTDQRGAFSLPTGFQCPSVDAQVYLVASGGNAGGGMNPDLVFMTALGSCSQLGAPTVVVNEATTVASVYALSVFMSDAQRVGSESALPAAIAAAFATANELVDIHTGVARAYTVSGEGIVPQAKIDTLANLLSTCAHSAGSSPGDDSSCDQLFQATAIGTNSTPQLRNTAQAVLNLARNATGFLNIPGSFAWLYRLASSSAAFEPALVVQPDSWTLGIRFAAPSPVGINSPPDISSAENAISSIDMAGNVWVKTNRGVVTEFVGGAASAGAPKILLPIALDSSNVR